MNGSFIMPNLLRRATADGWEAAFPRLAGHEHVKNNRKNTAHQGTVFSFELKTDRLTLKCLRFIPLAWVHLRDVECLRASYFSDFLPTRKRKWHRLVRNRHWPNSASGVWFHHLAPLYVIETRGKRRRIFLRMKPAFHYRLRVAISEAQHQESRADSSSMQSA